ncbi:RluA family pseudouridine synthase [Culicoidibacter larvae]|uniref:Pseudouridine synthase n=1 Tax=Culicoidibacter larvae TaxID=2579976 RepID=A0A5R8QB66_9FIRM|nr:RluA family pseudouridine synthase [Culicoidibacter larvae]TLG73821.1 RluA family pseudouridine synthase [Culicoidibacter larvae]
MHASFGIDQKASGEECAMHSFDGRRFYWTIEGNDVPNSIKSFLQDKQFSRRSLANLRSSGLVLVNEQQVELSYWLEAGDRLVIALPEVISQSMKPNAGKIEICYEDDYLLVVNKPAGLLTIPSRVENDDSLAQRVLAYYQQIELKSTIHVLTRLDKDTSGLVLIAKERHTQYLLGKASHVRMYYAIVSGRPAEDVFSIEQPIRKCTDSIIKREVHEDGKFARTHVEVVKTNGQYSLVKLDLDTGRTHQIRVHMASIDCPLLGDTLYGGESIFDDDAQMLHAGELRFVHPYSHEEIIITAKYPQKFADVLRAKLYNND